MRPLEAGSFRVKEGILQLADYFRRDPAAGRLFKKGILQQVDSLREETCSWLNI
jgi:hypothetical protein